MALMLLVAGCDSRLPLPLPWTTSQSEVVQVLSEDYEVSRFWACAWRSACPSKTWTYCFRVTPKTPEAALFWYEHFHSSNLKAIRGFKSLNTSLSAGLMGSIERQEQQIREPGTNPSQLENMQKELEGQRNELRAVEQLERELSAIEARDATFSQQLVGRLTDGLVLTAFYTISHAGKPNASHSGFVLRNGCAI